MIDPNDTKSVPETPEKETTETPENSPPTRSKGSGVDWREVADDVGKFVVDAIISIMT